MLNEDARELLASGVVICVATRGPDLAPALTPAMGVEVRGPTHVTLYLPPSASTQLALRNIHDNGLVCATFCRPHDHRTMQLRADVRGVREATDQDRAQQEGYRGALAEQLAIVGVPRGVTRRLTFWPPTVLELEVTAVFDQTPGPRAGAKIAG